jgi:hypothetical protein
MALILGERSKLDRAWMDRYAQAGIVHILAISGLHMGLLMVLLGWIYIPLRLLPQGNYLQGFYDHPIALVLRIANGSKCIGNPCGNDVLALQYRNLPQKQPAYPILTALIIRHSRLQQSVIHQTIGVSNELSGCIWDTHLTAYPSKDFIHKEQITASLLGDDNGYLGSLNSSKSISYLSFPSVSRLIS